MPDILVYLDRETVEKLELVFDIFSDFLRQATADSFTDLKRDPDKVTVMYFPYCMESNAPKIQIVGMVSFTEQREAELEEWKNNLIGACIAASESHGFEFLRELIKLKKVEVWPTMPIGTWGLVQVRSD